MRVSIVLGLWLLQLAHFGLVFPVRGQNEDDAREMVPQCSAEVLAGLIDNVLSPCISCFPDKEALLAGGNGPTPGACPPECCALDTLGGSLVCKQGFCCVRIAGGAISGGSGVIVEEQTILSTGSTSQGGECSFSEIEFGSILCNQCATLVRNGRSRVCDSNLVPIPESRNPDVDIECEGRVGGDVDVFPSAGTPATTTTPVQTTSGTIAASPVPAGTGDETVEGSSGSSAGESTAAACFPAHATVALRSGSTVRMDSLTVGDDVLVSIRRAFTNSFPTPAYSTVHMFSHRASLGNSVFVAISTESGTKPLVLSPGHILPRISEGATQTVMVAARDIQVGDAVLRVTKPDSNAKFVPVRVTKVGRTVAKGLYNPHTFSGSIVVDGVLASTYTEAVHPSLAHLLLAPLRAVWRVVGVDASFRLLERPATTRQTLKAAGEDLKSWMWTNLVRFLDNRVISDTQCVG